MSFCFLFYFIRFVSVLLFNFVLLLICPRDDDFFEFLFVLILFAIVIFCSVAFSISLVSTVQ